MNTATDRDWIEYDAAAEHCARKGLRGDIGDSLPANMSVGAWMLINDDVEAFRRRVQQFAYERAMRKVHDRSYARDDGMGAHAD